MMNRSYSSSSSGQQVPMVRNGSNGESKTSTEKVVEKPVSAAAAPLKYSDNDHHFYPDEKFEEFINRVRDETRRSGAVTTATTPTNTNPNKSMNTNTAMTTPTITSTNKSMSTTTATTTPTITNTDKSMSTTTPTITNTNKSMSTTTPTITNTNKSMNTTTATTKPVVTGLPLTSNWRSVPNNTNNNNNAQISKTVSGDAAMEFLAKEAMYKKKPSLNYNGKETEKLFPHVIKTEKIIDSKEASKRYGKIKSRKMDDDEGEHKVAIITSSEALEKYNGVFVP